MVCACWLLAACWRTVALHLIYNPGMCKMTLSMQPALAVISALSAFFCGADVWAYFALLFFSAFWCFDHGLDHPRPVGLYKH